MTRLIYCQDCKTAQYDSLKNYPDEWRRVKQGALLQFCRCDFCNQPLDLGDQAFAISLGLGDPVQTFWESDYLLEGERKP